MKSSRCMSNSSVINGNSMLNFVPALQMLTFKDPNGYSHSNQLVTHVMEGETSLSNFVDKE